MNERCWCNCLHPSVCVLGKSDTWPCQYLSAFCPCLLADVCLAFLLVYYLWVALASRCLSDFLLANCTMVALIVVGFSSRARVLQPASFSSLACQRQQAFASLVRELSHHAFTPHLTRQCKASGFGIPTLRSAAVIENTPLHDRLFC